MAREQERHEAATRRKVRSERRRADEVAADEEGALAPSILPTAPQPPQTTSTKAPPNAKGGRPPTRRRGRLGRNQYTKDRSSPTGGRLADEAAGDYSGIDSRGGSPRAHHLSANGETIGGRSGAKNKTINPHRTSMTDLKRRAGAILDFITRAQVELANDSFATEFMGDSVSAKAASASLTKKQQSTRKDGAERTAQGAVSGQEKPAPSSDEPQEAEWEGFEDLSGVEMMDVLTTKLIRWQAEYGKLEK